MLAFVAGDATRLPFADAAFDAVTISFGLRNVDDPDAGLREMLRVTRPGGRLVVCEFSSPTWSAVPHRLHRVPHARAAAGRPGGVVEPRRVRLPGRVDPGLARAGGAGGADPGRRVVDVAWRNLSGGIVALHHAVRPKA